MVFTCLNLSSLREILKRDCLKKKAASTNDPSIWKQFKYARNKASNLLKKAKRKYFSENLDANKSDPRKTWRLINELQSRQTKSTKVSQVKTGNQVFTSPGDIAEAFKTDSVQSSSNTCKNYLLKIYSAR